MFLVTVTHAEIPKNFQSFTVERVYDDPFIVTLVTDDFLSYVVSTQKGVSLIETPLPPSEKLNGSYHAVLSRVDFDKQSRTVEIYKSTNSGRPIYYHINKKGEFYCSTHISLLRKAGVPIQEDKQGLPECFIYGFVTPPLTLYKDIEQLFVGSRLYIELINGKCSIKSRRNFTLPGVNNELTSIKSISGKISELLHTSVQYLQPSTDRVAISLSGGVDSSNLYKVCNNLYGINTTYSTAYPFEDPESNMEKEYALSASKALNTTHNFVEFTATDYLEAVIEGIDAAEVPLLYTQCPMYYLFFRDGFPKDKNVIINGHGSEAAFGGGLTQCIYSLSKMPWRLLSRFPFFRLIEFISAYTSYGKGFVQNIRSRDYPFTNPDSVVWDLGAYASKEWVAKHFNVTTEDFVSRRQALIMPFKFEERNIYEVISILDLLVLAGPTQTVWSKLAEKSGKILYYPYMDTDELAYVYSVPWQIRFEGMKYLIKNVGAYNNVPEFILNRPKSGFSIEKHALRRWLNAIHSLIPLCREVFDGTEFHGLDLNNPKEALTYWNILNYGIWKRLQIQNESVEGLLEELRDIRKQGNSVLIKDLMRTP